MSSGIPLVGMALIGVLPPPLKRWYYRFRGARIEKNVRLGMFSYIDCPNIWLGEGVSIAPFTFIRAREYCRIGARSRIHAFTAIDTGRIEIGEDSAIGEQVTVGGILTPRSALVIGSRTKIFSYSFINPTERIEIGDEVCIGGGTYIFTHGTWPSMLEGFPGTFGPVTIGCRAWIAWRCFIMPNVTVGEEATIGAGSVVTRSIAARTLAMGSPAKTVKSEREYVIPLTEPERHARLMEWFREFHEYLAYMGWECSFSASLDSAEIRATASADSTVAVVYCRHSIPQKITHGGVYLSLEGINQEMRQACAQEGAGWFDIAAQECSLIPSVLCTELRTFLIRYGVRFAVQNSCV